MYNRIETKYYISNSDINVNSLKDEHENDLVCYFFLITGFGSGLGTPAAYLILTDLSLIRFRGMMATLNSFSNNFAWLIGLVIGKYCPLNVVILTYAMSPALFLILSPFLPESAVWLTKKGLEKEAVKALRCVRGPDYPVQVRMGVFLL